jgi:hypothetical protein
VLGTLSKCVTDVERHLGRRWSRRSLNGSGRRPT